MQKIPRFDKTTRLVLLFSLVVLLAATLVVRSEYQRNYNRVVAALQEQGRRLVMIFDHELKVQEMSLEILAAQADSILVGDKLPLNSVTAGLVVEEELGGYSLPVPEGKTEAQVGNLTGLGEIPDEDSELAREINMALSLSPIFEQIILNNTNLPWVYYTSASRFAYLYPRVPVQEFFFSDRLLETEFFRVASPSQNPSRRLVYSSLYEDEAGAGLMVTLSKPLYAGERFLGVLSIDLGISSLKWMLKSAALTSASPYLIGPDGRSMVGLDGQAIQVDLASTPFETLTRAGEHTFMLFKLNQTDWYLLLDVDPTRLALEAVNSSAYLLLVILSVVFSLILVLVITINMRTARYLATHDQLTGLLNRRGYDEISWHAVQRSVPGRLVFAIAVIDIDFFKKYNDQYGHIAGDNILRRVANALKNSLRDSNDILVRTGGEEFAAMLLVNHPDELSPILERMVQSVSALGIPHIQSPYGCVTVSVGAVTGGVEMLKNVEAMYSHADQMLYQVKENGRNAWLIGERLAVQPGFGA
jgi:diguanylate cyclase (GGDEF)-like protein